MALAGPLDPGILKLANLRDTLTDYLSGRLSLPELNSVLADSRESARAALQTLDDFNDAGKLPAGLYQELRQHYLIPRAASSVTSSQQDNDAVEPSEVDNDATLRISVSRPHPAEGVGRMLNGRFVLDKIIARGGMAVIYKARDLRKEEARDRDPFVAVKVISEDFAARHAGAFVALEREAKKAQKLAHPNIVTVYDFDRDGDTVYLTMELLEGEPLSELLKRTPADGFPTHETMPIIAAIGEGLAYAHKKGIVHADLKPSNVFLTPDGEVKLLDLGIARALDRPGEQQTTTTVFDPQSLGALTPSYASPEMFEPESQPDPRDDIYALSCVAYELLSGHHPFGKCPANKARESGLQPNRIKKLSKRRWQALKQGLALDREARTPNVREFLQEVACTEKTQRPMTRPALWGGLGLGALVLGAIGFLYRPSEGPTPGGQAGQTPDDRQSEIAALPTHKSTQAARAQQIAQLLDEAQARVKAGQLTEPQGSSALTHYRQVLDLDSGNADATAGLTQIARHYTAKAQRYRQAQAWTQGLTAVAHGLQARPEDPELLALQSQIHSLQADESQREEEIAALLAKAEAQRQALRLTRPTGDNAYQSLQRVLELKPGHPEATAGLKKIADAYQELARANWRKGDVAQASTGIERGLALDPDHRGLLALRDEVQAGQKQAYEHDFDTLLREAESLRAAQDWTASLATIERGLRAQADHPALLSLRERVKADQAEAGRRAALTQQINRLLGEAREHMQAGRFAEPHGDNALELYRHVLNLDSENRGATRGLVQIADHCEAAARDYSEAENWTQSLAEIERGLRAQPQHRGLLSLRKHVYAEIEALRQPKKKKKLRVFGTF